MPEIIVLPPAAAPTQLTARYVSQSLGEHWTAFLAANNMAGWVRDDDYILRDDRIGDLLLTISATTGLYLGQFKHMASAISALSKESGSKIQLSAVNEIVAKALGYYSYNFAYKCRTTDDFIENVWPTGAALSLTELDIEAGDVRQHLYTKNRLMDRLKMNISRDRRANLDSSIKRGSRERIQAQKLKPLTFR